MFGIYDLEKPFLVKDLYGMKQSDQSTFSASNIRKAGLAFENIRLKSAHVGPENTALIQRAVTELEHLISFFKKTDDSSVRLRFASALNGVVSTYKTQDEASLCEVPEFEIKSLDAWLETAISWLEETIVVFRGCLGDHNPAAPYETAATFCSAWYRQCVNRREDERRRFAA